MNESLRVLIVDDDRRMTHTLADILSLQGHEGVEAWTGVDALDRVRSEPFDCVLTDIRMPGMNGVELYGQLHRIRPELPVLLMTAYAAEQLIQEGLDEGVVGAMEKPLNIDHLLGFLDSLARSRSVTLVDDDPAFCQTLGDILDKRGFRVLKISDPTTSPELIASDAQVVLLDMKLNQLSGLDVLRELRRFYPDLPVLLVTGYWQEMAGAIEASLAINACACLCKPLVIPELLLKLAEIRTGSLRKALGTE